MNKLDRIDPARLASNPRATLASWLKYKDLAISAYRQHPRPFTYEPQNMSASTIASRLRDAIAGCLAFKYECPIPHHDLLRWWSETVIKHTPTEVIIGPIQKMVQPLEGMAPQPSRHTFSFHTLELDELLAFNLLLARGRIPGPIRIETPPDLSMLPEHPNVTRVYEDTTLILI